jgi:signal transduction histidine kinase
MTPQPPSRIGDRAEETVPAETLLHLQKMEACALLAVGVVHDINNILQSGRLAAEAIGRRREELQEAIAPVLEAIEMASALTRELFEFVRSKTTAAHAVDLREVGINVVRLMGRTLPVTIKLVVRLPENIWPVLLSAGQCAQVLLNLLVNARDAMPDGGVLTVQIVNHRVTPRTIERCRPSDQHSPPLHPGDYVALRVKDTGTGVPLDRRTRIYEPFWTSKEAVGGGIGLGLTLCHSIVGGAGGTILVEGNGKAGAIFTVLLPRHHEEALAASTPP